MRVDERRPAAGAGQGRDAVHAADEVHVRVAPGLRRAAPEDEAHQLGLAPRPVRGRDHLFHDPSSLPVVRRPAVSVAEYGVRRDARRGAALIRGLPLGDPFHLARYAVLQSRSVRLPGVVRQPAVHVARLVQERERECSERGRQQRGGESAWIDHEWSLGLCGSRLFMWRFVWRVLTRPLLLRVATDRASAPAIPR